MAAQEQAIKKNAVKGKIDTTQKIASVGCVERLMKLNDVVSECRKQAQW